MSATDTAAGSPLGIAWAPDAGHEIWHNTRVRRTPFTARVEALGVQAYSVYNHTLIPLSFRGVVEDYWHLKEHVQLWDVSCERQVEVAGPDAARLVQLATCRDLSAATIGRCMYAPLVDQRGGVVNDPVLLKLADDRFWVSIADLDVGPWLDGLAHGLGLDVEVSEPDIAPLAVQGPKSEELVSRVFGDAVRDVKFFRFERLEFQGHPMVVARTGWSKQGGFEIYLDRPELGLALWDALWDAGHDLDVGPGCPNLIERIEGGLLSYGGDMTRANNPFECGFDAFIHLDRDIDFIGRPALEAIAAAGGPRRRVAGLFIDATSLPRCRDPWPVSVDGAVVGHVTSAAVSPERHIGVAIAMLDVAAGATGTACAVATSVGTFDATVGPLPFEPL